MKRVELKHTFSKLQDGIIFNMYECINKEKIQIIDRSNILWLNKIIPMNVFKTTCKTRVTKRIMHMINFILNC